MKFTKSDVVEMVDALFDCYDSYHRTEARNMLFEMMVKREQLAAQPAVEADAYAISAKKDGLWLITPKADGKQDVLRIDAADKQGTPLNMLWQKLYNQTAKPDVAG